MRKFNLTKFLAILLLVNSITFLLNVEKNLYALENNQSSIEILKQFVIPLKSLDDNQAINQLIAQKSIVLIGDSTHGTHEFYQQRINISQQLIQEKNFKLIFLEGDWPNVYTLNQYIHSQISLTAAQVLNASSPDAAWLWSNLEMVNFLQWLKHYNDLLPEGDQKVSLHGMDIYSFEQSKQRLIAYLKSFSLPAAQQAQRRYQCFDQYSSPSGIDLHRYGQAVSQNFSLSCQAEVVTQYEDFSECRFPCPAEYTFIDRDAFFDAQQNARIVKNTEQSIRLQHLFDSDTYSWNLRDCHMMESLLASMTHLDQTKAIIWAHNSHLGDARATEMTEREQINLGQILRQHFKQTLFSIGMLTYAGQVMAADDWGTPAKLKTLLAAHPDSNEALLHRIGVDHFLLPLQPSSLVFEILGQPRLQRHVGVVYHPQDELSSHYTGTLLAKQFDAIIFHDVTSAVRSFNK